MSEDLKEILDYVEKKMEQVKKELEMLRLLRKYLEEKLWEAAPQIRPQKPAEQRERWLATAIESARWRAYRSGRGEWCFADELPKEFVDELRKGPLEFRGHTYVYRRLSGGKEIVARR